MPHPPAPDRFPQAVDCRLEVGLRTGAGRHRADCVDQVKTTMQTKLVRRPTVGMVLLLTAWVSVPMLVPLLDGLDGVRGSRAVTPRRDLSTAEKSTISLFQSASLVRAAVFLRRAFNIAKNCSTGFRSGE